MAISSTSYAPGESGNRNGRPTQDHSITETFREMFRSDPSLKSQLAQKILEKALSGDISASKLIWGYMDGLPVQKAEMSDSPLPIPILNGITFVDMT